MKRVGVFPSVICKQLCSSTFKRDLIPKRGITFGTKNHVVLSSKLGFTHYFSTSLTSTNEKDELNEKDEYNELLKSDLKGEKDTIELQSVYKSVEKFMDEKNYIMVLNRCHHHLQNKFKGNEFLIKNVILAQSHLHRPADIITFIGEIPQEYITSSIIITFITEISKFGFTNYTRASVYYRILKKKGEKIGDAVFASMIRMAPSKLILNGLYHDILEQYGIQTQIEESGISELIISTVANLSFNIRSEILFFYIRENNSEMVAKLISCVGKVRSRIMNMALYCLVSNLKVEEAIKLYEDQIPKIRIPNQGDVIDLSKDDASDEKFDSQNHGKDPVGKYDSRCFFQYSDGSIRLLLTSAARAADFGNPVSYSSLAEKLWSKAIRHGFDPSPPCYHALLEIYIKEKQYEAAFRTIAHMDRQNVPFPVQLVDLLSKSISKEGNANVIDDAYYILVNMRESSEYVSISSFNAIINACVMIKDLDRAFATFNELSQHDVQPNIDTYNILIFSCYGGRQPDTAFQLFNDAIQSGLEPTDKTFESLLMASTRYNTLTKGFQIVDKMIQENETIKEQHLMPLLKRALYLNDARSMDKIKTIIDDQKVAISNTFQSLLETPSEKFVIYEPPGRVPVPDKTQSDI